MVPCRYLGNIGRAWVISHQPDGWDRGGGGGGEGEEGQEASYLGRGRERIGKSRYEPVGTCVQHPLIISTSAKGDFCSLSFSLSLSLSLCLCLMGKAKKKVSSNRHEAFSDFLRHSHNSGEVGRLFFFICLSVYLLYMNNVLSHNVYFNSPGSSCLMRLIP